MPPQEPQYLLVDSNDNTLGAVYIDDNDDLVFNHAASGNEVFLGSSGLSDGTNDFLTALGIEDDGVSVINATNINAGTNLSVTDDGDGTVTIDASSGSGSLSGLETTFIIRPSGSDYLVIDETGSTVTTETTGDAAIQYAYNNLPADGGVIHLSEGTFDITSPVSAVSDSTLIGERSSVLTVSGDITAFNSSSVSNVQMRGFTLDDDQTNDSESGIQFNNSTNITISNIKTLGHFNAIISRGCDGFYVRNCRMVDFLSYGVGTQVPDETDLNTTDLEVSGCEFLCSTDSLNAVAAYRVDEFRIVDNYAESGFHSHYACSPAENGTITGNVSLDSNINGQSGPDAGGEAGIELEFKDSHGSETTHDVTVTGNTVRNAEVGILTRVVGGDDTTDAPYALNIGSNTIHNCDTGAKLMEGDDINLHDNTFRNNTTEIDIQANTTNTERLNNTIVGTTGVGQTVVSGSTTLSSGSATVDTGVSNATSWTFSLALGPDTADADVAGDIRADSGVGNYVIDIEETDTSVGNPTVRYAVRRES